MSHDLPPPLARAAERLRHAEAVGRTCAPVRSLIGEGNIEAAYTVQEHVATLRSISGASVVGRKVGLTASAVQFQLGVDHPTIGTLMDTMQVPHGGAIPVRKLLQPRIEAELAFRIGEDLTEPDITPQRARAAVSEIVASLEILDSRIAGWNITAVDTIADNASAGLFVLASEGRQLADRDLQDLTMKLRRNGEVVSSGSGGDNHHGDPIGGLAWLANEAVRRNIPLLEGQIVLAGALGPVVDIAEGDSFSAEIGDLPTVEVHVVSSVEARAIGLPT